MEVNKVLRVMSFKRPTDYDVQCLYDKADRAVELGMISERPIIDVAKPTNSPFWVFLIECLTQDRPFWFGFYEGRVFVQDHKDTMIHRDTDNDS